MTNFLSISSNVVSLIEFHVGGDIFIILKAHFHIDHKITKILIQTIINTVPQGVKEGRKQFEKSQKREKEIEKSK